jgi:putative membrane protein
MTVVDLLSTAWDWKPSVVAGCAALAIAYIALMRRGPSARMLYFLGGVFLLLLSLVSPLDTLGDEYLFSAHIVQHFLLALIIPPLLLLGIPRSLGEVILRLPIPRPPVAWLLGVGTMAVWHIPALFNAALASEALHIAQHLSFLATGAIFWWPILSPVAEDRLSPLAAISYLFSACVSCSLLGAALTFARPGLYPAYLNPDDRLGILHLLRDDLGLNPRADQQLGGMLMWVPGCFVYLSAILGTVARWYAAPSEDADAARA